MSARAVFGKKPTAATLVELLAAGAVMASVSEPLARPSLANLIQKIAPVRKPRRTFEPHDGDRAKARRLRQQARIEKRRATCSHD